MSDKISYKSSNFISAVIYVQPGESYLMSFMEFINKIFIENFKKFEFICVNDGAGNDVDNDLQTFKKNHPESTVTVVKMGDFQGLETAMNAGIDRAIGDYVFEFDSCYIDYKEDLITDVYTKAISGYDVVSAVPPKKCQKKSARCFYSIFNHFSDLRSKITTERFQLISRRAINRASEYSNTTPYRKAVYASIGLNTAKIEYPVISDIRGQLLKRKNRLYLAVNSLIIFTSVAYKIAFFVSIVMAVLMLISGIYTIVVYFGTFRPVEGWAPIMGLISAGFCALFSLTTVIIKYLDLILNMIFKHQKYSVESIDKL